MEIISESHIEKGVDYYLSFEWRQRPGSGFSFPCDEEGSIDWDRYDTPQKAAARTNLNGCLCGEYDVVFCGMETREWSYKVPRVGRCSCGEEVELSRFTNTCYKCDTDYNSAGQQLAPREQWGYETGEHWTDCI